MALDVRGSLKKAKLNSNIYIFIDELFSNAVDSFLIRKHLQKDVKDFKIKFSTDITSTTLDASQKDLSITCTDNGIGLGVEQTKAFITKDTSYKDDLHVEGIGECKGSGRIQYLLYFSNMAITSVYKNAGGSFLKTLAFSESSKEIDDSSFKVEPTTRADIGFAITLSSLKPELTSRIFLYHLLC
jgi:hypothetical protein